ncbi:uncharacterized protein [Hetaerina americana]|uniref:uncharacterized protein n=1 Tax=Hetaerina americana TaxID=62018 RepID=UPI003A7F45D5
MAGKKFYVSPETFADFLLGRDVSIRSIDSKGADHPVFKEAAGVFLGVDDEQSCKAVHSYWIRRGQEIVKILNHGSNAERKKEARLRYFLEMTGLKLIKREEILSGGAKETGATDSIPEVEHMGNVEGFSHSKCSYSVPSPCCESEIIPQVVAMEVEVPQCNVLSSCTSSSDDSDGEKEDYLVQDYQWQKEGEFTVSFAEWLSICEKGLKLSRKWTSLISQKFYIVNSACVIQFQGYHFNKQSRSDTPFLMVRGYCAHVSCKRFRLTMKSPPTANEDAPMIVWGRGSEKHGDKKKTRQLKGWDRLHAKKALMMKKAHLYREEKVREADKSALMKGNLQGIKSLNVLRRARAEALREEGLI